MKSASAGESSKARLLSEINVTPFVDVMLVLLIIFMVTAPMLQQGLSLSLPSAKSAGAAVSKQPFILRIERDQKIYIGDRPVRLGELSEKLEALFEHKRGRAVYLQADKSIPYGIVARALGEIKSSGISDVSLITNVK